MEAFGGIFDEEWESLSRLFSTDDSDVVLHFNGGNSFQNMAGFEESLIFTPAAVETNLYCVSQESSENETALFTNGVGFPFDFSMPFSTLSESFTLPVFGDDVMEDVLSLKGSEMGDSCNENQMKRKNEEAGIDEDNVFDQSPKKKPRIAQKNKRNPQSRKSKKAQQIANGEDEKSPSSCSSEENDSNASQELNASDSRSGKAKASKSPATDPQSLYARRRRERINERLKILQNLVPNGTKVDISTMLEEAVHYVKFLQLQIKLLSSNDHWMYAPIAYNGMDMGLYQKMLPNLC